MQHGRGPLPGAEPGALAHHLTTALVALIGSAAGANDRYLLAVSGGPDSMALLALAADTMPGRIEAATVDHALRPESAEEAAMVADVAHGLGVAHHTLTVGAIDAARNLQAQARAARYDALDELRSQLALDWVVTAHHADDQVETLWMRLDRGSGVAGLSGIRARNGRVLRPLLGVRKADLVAFAEQAKLPFVTDLSNADPRHDRARVRKMIAELPINAVGWTQSAQALAEADAALDWALGTALKALPEGTQTHAHGPVIADPGLPPLLLRRQVERALTSLEPGRVFRGETLTNILSAMLDGRPVTAGGHQIAPIASENGANRWVVRPVAPHHGR